MAEFALWVGVAPNFMGVCKRPLPCDDCSVLPVISVFTCMLHNLSQLANLRFDTDEIRLSSYLSIYDV